jgi:hypothetical protein
MPKEIPFLSPRQLNTIEDYERFYHTKAYLRSLTIPARPLFKGATDTTSRLAAAMNACGYRNLQRFLHHKQDWDHLKRRIPLTYWDCIGVERSVVELTLEADREDYEAALRLPLHPTHATIRVAPAVYVNHRLPDGADEHEAVEYLVEKSKELGKSCCINYTGLKTVTVNRDGEVNTIYYPPQIVYTGSYAMPTSAGSEVGTSCVS